MPPVDELELDDDELEDEDDELLELEALEELDELELEEALLDVLPPLLPLPPQPAVTNNTVNARRTLLILILYFPGTEFQKIYCKSNSSSVSADEDRNGIETVKISINIFCTKKLNIRRNYEN